MEGIGPVAVADTVNVDPVTTTTTSTPEADGFADRIIHGGEKEEGDKAGSSPLSTTTSSSLHEQNNNSNVSKPSIRHAEKRRTATCKFADRIAQISVDHYRAIISPTIRPPQTCIATIVAHIRPTDSDSTANKNCNDTNDNDNNKDGTNQLRVIAMGIGTKFLPETTIRQEEFQYNDDDDAPNQYGSRVRDMHAEVLARRAFRRQLTLEMLHDLQQQQQKRNGRYNTNEIDDDNGGDDGCGDGHDMTTILTRSQPLSSNSAIRYKLKDGVTLHMYTSSAPCGNATLKKFCKMSKERFRDDLGPDAWPTTPHIPPLGHGMKQGEFALLIKRDATSCDTNRTAPSLVRPFPFDVTQHPSRTTTILKKEPKTKINLHSNAATMPLPVDQAHQTSRTSRRPKKWPADISDDWTPPGTTIVGFKHKGSIHTCSDKICRWNILGIQGSLLTRLLDEPLYLTTLIVGRKFSEPVCRRAVCCRLVDPRPIMMSMSAPSQCPSIDDDDDDNVDNGILAYENSKRSSSYRVNHPAVLGTAVYVDENGVVETDSDNKGQDVRFHSTLTYAWWPGSPPDVATSSSLFGVLECIDGSTGFLGGVTAGPETQSLQSPPERDNDTTGVPVSSKLSTIELTKLVMHVDQLASASSTGIETDECSIDRTLSRQSSGFVTLMDLRTLKKDRVPVHEHIKERLLTQHRVFKHWRRRIYDYE